MDYDIDVVLSKDSLDLIRHWNADLARMLEFFDSRFDRDCTYLHKVIRMFDNERRADPDFDRLYQTTIATSHGVRG